MVAAAIRAPWTRISRIKDAVRMPSFGFLGGSFNRPSSGGSIPMAMAGRESVIRLINSRCTGLKGRGRDRRDVYNTQKMPAMLPDKRNWMEFFIFLYTFLPLDTAFMMVAKLSSANIMDAASLDTSVPVIPMATPISAFLRAGASLTPSPVIATMCPRFCHALTIRILCSGDTLA